MEHDLTLAEALGALAAGTTHDNLPKREAQSIPFRVLDIAGICVRAGELATTQSAIEFVVDQGGRPDSMVIGTDHRLPAPLAAFANGVAAHSLDYDDTHLPSILHPSASVIPAVLATAEAEGADARTVVAATAAGLEVAVRLGMAGYDRGHRRNIWFDRGLHATSICGAIGSAAAAGRILGLDPAGIVDSMGVAASMASGIIEANRTGGTVKRIHCGWAAQAGVTAAHMARRGLTGPPTVFEGRFGLFEAFLGGEFFPDEAWAGMDPEHPAAHEWMIADISYKPYPANHYTHCAIDAAMFLRDRHGLRPADVDRIEVGVAGATVRTIGEPPAVKQAPETGYQAQFSGPYVVAAALFGGSGLGLGLADFTDELARDPDRRELMARVHVVPDPECDEVYPDEFPAILRVRTRDGTELVKRVMANRGGAQRPLTDDELAGKFSDNVAGLLDDAARQQAIDVIHRFPDCELPDLLGALST